MTWLLSKLNATSYVSWRQGQKGRTLSPLQLGTAGMILSEQTSNTTLNTLHEVRHRFFSSFSPADYFDRTLFLSLCSFWSGAGFSFGPLAAVGWGPFCSGEDPTFGSSMCCMSLSTSDFLAFELPLAYLSLEVTGALVPHPPISMVLGLVFLCTCVSVRRRDRCTRTLSFHFFGFALSYLCARPFSLFNDSNFFVPILRSSALRSAQIWSCCPLPRWWSCGSLDVLPCWALGIF